MQLATISTKNLLLIKCLSINSNYKHIKYFTKMLFETFICIKLKSNVLLWKGKFLRYDYMSIVKTESNHATLMLISKYLYSLACMHMTSKQASLLSTQSKVKFRAFGSQITLKIHQLECIRLVQK